jgi:hypothetical protein
MACLVASLCAADAAARGPYTNGKFQGRIAYSADGNHNDPDDWAASPVALAILAEAGLKDRLVHFDYNCILPKTDPDWEKTHAESVLGAAERYGYRKELFHDCRKNLDAAIASIARAIDGSSAEDPLYFIVAGPMEVPYLGIQKSQPDKRRHVYCISHSRWNDGFARQYTFTHTKRSVIESGIHWVQIRDQNRLLSKSPYGQPAPADSWQAYHWMRDSSDAKVRWLWERLQVSTRPDPSDAGMAWFLATGDEDADPAKLKALLDGHEKPQLVATRPQVRIEAENFRTLSGFEVEDTNDRNASHRLQVRLAKGPAGKLATSLAQPYAAGEGRFDVQIRCMGEGQSPGRVQLLVDGVAQGEAWKSAGTDPGWVTHTVKNVALRPGSEIAIDAQGTGLRIDYVQLDRQ